MFEHFKVNITPFNRDRIVRVYLPNSYNKDVSKNYPVLYMHDGQNLFKDEDASYGMSWEISDFLDERGVELIVVGIDCADGLQRSTAAIDHQLYINSSQKIYELLKGKIKDCKFEVVEGAVHNEIAWKKRVPEIFLFLYNLALLLVIVDFRIGMRIHRRRISV
jgi:enterochelin esterase-like enzyme